MGTTMLDDRLRLVEGGGPADRCGSCLTPFGDVDLVLA